MPKHPFDKDIFSGPWCSCCDKPVSMCDNPDAPKPATTVIENLSKADSDKHFRSVRNRVTFAQ